MQRSHVDLLAVVGQQRTEGPRARICKTASFVCDGQGICCCTAIYVICVHELRTLTCGAELQGTSELAVSQDYSRSSPGEFLKNDVNRGSFWVHARNQTAWCWQAADVATIFTRGAALPEGPISAGGSGTLAVWARWLAALGAAPLLLPVQ